MADSFVSISSNAATVAATMAQKPKAITDKLFKVLNNIGAALNLAIIRDKLSGDPLARRSSRLQHAIRFTVKADGQDVVLTMIADASKAPYAAAQEYGATIRPTKSQFLTIPLEPALTASGVARVSAHEFISNPGSLGFERTFVNKAKTAILGVTASGTVQAVFALKTQVILPERSYMRSTVADRRAWILDQLGAAGTSDGT